VKYLTEDS